MKDLIRFVRPQDAAHILEIYAPYITDTVISFEYEVPTPEEFAARVEAISATRTLCTSAKAKFSATLTLPPITSAWRMITR